MHTADLSAGTVEYEDTGGTGPVIVLLHGLLMGPELWHGVVPRLPGCRVIRPLLPLGAHRLAMRPDADLSLRGHARIVAELLDALDLRDVTLAFNDWAAPQILIADGLTDRVGRLLLASCETAGNYPPGLPGKNLVLLGHLPGGLVLALHALRVRPLRRTPLTFGWMSKRPIPDRVLDEWLAPARRDEAVRRDLRKYVTATRGGRKELEAATRHLAAFERPVTVLWAAEDKVMPVEEGRHLAGGFPDARFALVQDSYSLIPLDQPVEAARHLLELLDRPVEVGRRR